MNEGTGYKGGGSAGVPATGPGASATGEAALLDLLAEFDERLRGAAPGAAARPDDASDARLRGAMDCLRLLESVFPRHTSDAGHPASIGRFQIHRCLGRGGFGIVYLAHDPHLGRAVALKVPHSDGGWDSARLDRFRREAVAAAALDHPNIVPVYDAGEADGRQFIAMAYCPGITLGEWLARQPRPVDARHAADLVRVIADAVHHAHERGVVHRDLKPANILLIERGGAAGVLADGAATGALRDYQAKVSDFGLAKRLDDATITHTGSITGTPNYMAPEQVDGDAGQVGPASDVYALGAILYELLTGRAPHQGDSALATLYSVRHVEPVAPSRLRTRLSRDLETICVKCLEKLACDRYASARELSEELSRYLDGTPIRARPVTPPIRVARWCRRKPLVTGLAAALLLALSLGATGLAIHRSRVRHDEAEIMERSREAADAWRAAEASFARATRAAAAADAHLQSNVATADRLLDMSDGLLRQPRLDARGRRVLEELIDSYHRFLDEKSQDPSARLRTARALIRVGELCGALGQFDRAEKQLADARDVLQPMVEAVPDEWEQRRDLVRCWFLEGFFESRRASPDHWARAATLYERALAEVTRLAAAEPGRKDLKAFERLVLDNFGRVQLLLGRLDSAEPMLRRALDIQQQLAARSPGDANERCQLASAMECMSQVEQARLRFVDARGWLRQALGIQEKLVADDPASREFRHHLGWLHGRAGSVAVELRNLDDAAGHYAEAIKWFQGLYDERPGDHETRSLLASFQDLAGANYLTLNDPRRAAEAYGAALTLVAPSPDDSLARRKTAYFYYQLGSAQRGTGEREQAARSFGRSLDLHATLPDEFPNETAYRDEIAYRSRDMGVQLREMGEFGTSERALSQALVHFAALAKARPNDAAPVRELAATWRCLGDSRRAARAMEPACDAIEKAVRLRGELVAAGGRDVEDDRSRLAEDRRVLADCYAEKANELIRGGDERAAEAAFRSALRFMPESGKAANGLAWLLSTSEDLTLRAPGEARELAERAVRSDPTSANFANTLGAALYRAGDYGEAILAMDRAIGLRGEGNSEDWYFQAMARWKLGEQAPARTDFGRAEAWMLKHDGGSRETRRLRDEAAHLLGFPADD